ncbi:ABC transporter [Ceratobasidium sp. AG-Ba]|nr:ABC transporter [Ceratobasidium sp. AG-Ba]
MSKNAAKATHTDKDDAKSELSMLQEKKVGVWSMYFAQPQTPLSKNSNSDTAQPDKLSSLSAMRLLKDIWRFVVEAVSVGPTIFALYFGASAASNLVPVLQLANNARFLGLLQTALLTKQLTSRDDFIVAVVFYLLLVGLGWVARRIKNRTEPVLQQRLTLHIKKRILATQIQFDMATATNPALRLCLSWRGHLDKYWCSTCVAQPLLSSLKLQSYIGMQGYYAMITNKSWLGMNALFELGTDNSYKKEVLGGNLSRYVLNEYEREMKELGDISGEKPEVQLWKNEAFSSQDQQSIFQPLPLLLFAYRSMTSVHGLNLSSIFLIQQGSTAIEHSVLHALHSLNMFSGIFQDASGLYNLLDMTPSMKEGTVDYPEDPCAHKAGMGIEFKSVWFTYPHSERQVLRNMSFSIPAGKLCVIVGENGCGKSSTIQLLTRLYDASAGEILVDGQPIRNFTTASIRSAMSVMYQDYKHLPLTIYENILLGRPTSADPYKEVEQAANLGGAYTLIQKLPAKFQTNLKPQSTGYSPSHSGTDGGGPFASLISAQKPIELSGGEWQRLALSRTFMKNANNVKPLCYDEPSASLDPKAEQELFERLRELRGEKTMIFVTHRFGYLTKHADLILYMSDGAIIEHGSHEELLGKKGDYAKMYNIQAQAFL